MDVYNNESWKKRIERFKFSIYKSVYVDENAKQELLLDLLQVYTLIQNFSKLFVYGNSHTIFTISSKYFIYFQKYFI